MFCTVSKQYYPPIFHFEGGGGRLFILHICHRLNEWTRFGCRMKSLFCLTFPSFHAPPQKTESVDDMSRGRSRGRHSLPPAASTSRGRERPRLVTPLRQWWTMNRTVAVRSGVDNSQGTLSLSGLMPPCFESRTWGNHLAIFGMLGR